MGEAVKLQAIVLNRVDYKESDRILTLLSPEKGKLTVSARGVKKQASKLVAVVIAGRKAPCGHGAFCLWYICAE